VQCKWRSQQRPESIFKTATSWKPDCASRNIFVDLKQKKTMAQSNESEAKRSKAVAVVVGVLTISALATLVYSVNLNMEIDKLTKESNLLKKQLEECSNRTAK
jgi:hypothetical protein